MPKNWIVLINKIPRGPFTEADLKVLIQDNIIKKSDLVIEQQKNKEHSSQWLFVWQALELSEPDFEKETKRAEKKEPQTLSEPILEEELLRISPEELLIKTTQAKQFDGDLKFRRDEEESEEVYASPTRLPYRSLVFPFFAVIMIAMGIQYTFKFINNATTQRTVASPTEVATPENAPMPIMKRRNLASPNSPRAKTIPKDNQGLLNIPKQEEPVSRPPEPEPQQAPAPMESDRNVDSSRADEGEVDPAVDQGEEEVPVKKKAKKVKVEEEAPEEGAQAAEEEAPGPNGFDEEGGPQIPKN